MYTYMDVLSEINLIIIMKINTHGRDVIPYIKRYHCQFSQAISVHIGNDHFEREGYVA